MPNGLQLRAAATGSLKSPPRHDARPILILVVVVAALVHCFAAHAAGKTDINLGTQVLPPNVTETRDLILAAVHSGKLEDLKSAFEGSGAKPETGLSPADDPIAALKAVSSDGNGREILAVLAEILEMPPAALPLGRDLENNLIYVWPYLAEKPLDKLSEREEVDLYRLVSVPKAAEMRDKKRWTWWRLTIGADGTWQSFKKPD